MTLSKTNKGFTLIEVLIYIFGFLIVMVIMSLFIVQTYKIYHDITMEPRINQIGLSLADKLSRDIRSGESLNLNQSIFGVANGALSINSQSEEDLVKRFSLQDSRVIYQENNNDPEPLTPADIEVSGLTFHLISTPISQAVRYNFDIVVETREGLTTKSYTGLAILRSYE